jgi:restriction system protein
MPIPDFQSLMLPLLRACNDTAAHTAPEMEEKLAVEFNLTAGEVQEMLSSGNQRRFLNRLSWVVTHLAKAGLLERPRRAVFMISTRGKSVLSQNPASINVPFLRQYPEYLDFNRPPAGRTTPTLALLEEQQAKSPKEVLDDAYTTLRKSLQSDLLEKLRDPQFHWRRFEKLVVDLLVKMGYGGKVSDAGQVTQATNDGGIDGLIKEDKLGLEVIYLQAKKWGVNHNVGRPDIQSFVGALEERRAMKGVFITTSAFAQTAHDYVKNIGKKVILIDGEQLTGLMIDYNIGVSTEETYEIKRIDSDYFDVEA